MLALETVPRSVGSLRLSTKRVGARTQIDRFRTSGAMKVAFPRQPDIVEGIMLNTSGGLTGGDRFDTVVSAGDQSHLTLTTQAAERAYRSLSDTARVTTHLAVGEGAALHWLPQELIVFDGASLERSLTVDLHETAELVLVEPIVFGRHAMGETRVGGALRDTITLRRAEKPLFWDRICLTGAISGRLEKIALTRGMSALASVIYVGPRAEAVLSAVRSLLPETGGVSLLSPGLLNVRLLAEDSFLLRRTLVPILRALTGRDLPKSWSL